MKLFIFNDRIETLCSDVLLLPIYLDERPLKGISATVDWRINNKISHLIIQKTISAELMSSTIFCPKSKLQTRKLFILGLGYKSHLTESHLHSVFRHALSQVHALNLTDFAIPISRFVAPHISFDQVTFSFLDQLMVNRQHNKPFPNKAVIVVNDEYELKWLANCIKRLEENIPQSISTEIMDRESYRPTFLEKTL